MIHEITVWANGCARAIVPVPVGGAGHHSSSRVFSYGADGSPPNGDASAIGSPSIIDSGSPPGAAFGASSTSPPSVYQMPMSPDEDDEEAEAVRARGDAFFEDDLAFDDDADASAAAAEEQSRPQLGASVPLRNSAGEERPGLARFGTLSFPGVPMAEEEEDEEEQKRDLQRTLTIQRNAEQMGEFNMGGGDAADAEPEEEPEEQAQDDDDEAGDLFDQDVVIGALDAYADEDDDDDPFRRGGGGAPGGLVPSASMGFSANPIGLPRANSMGFASNPLAAAGGDDDDDFGDNAIGQDGVYLFDDDEDEQKLGDVAFASAADAAANNPDNAEEDDEEIVHFKIDQHVHVPDMADGERKHEEEEEDQDPEYQYDAAVGAGQLNVPLASGIEGSSPSSAPHHHPQQSSRVFSYGGDEDGISGGEGQLHQHPGPQGGLHVKSISINGVGVIPEEQSPEDAEVAAAVNRERAAPSPSPSGAGDDFSPQPKVRRVDGGDHVRSDSLQVPGASPGGLPRSPSPQSGRLTPRGSIVRPSFASLQASTVHNKGLHRPGPPADPSSPSSAFDGPGRSPSSSHHRRISYITPVDLSGVQAEHRAELDALMTVAEHKAETSFPYSLDTPVGKDAYELLTDLPAVGESRRVAEFQEPVLGAISAIKNEQVKSVLLSDAITDKAEAPTRFTRPQRKREFAPNVSLRGLAALTAEVKAQRSHAHIECLLLFNEKTHAAIKQDVASMIGALTGLQTIQFQDMKIKEWEHPLTLPRLLNLDIRSCSIKDLSRVTQICLNSPQLYSLTMSDNPICDKFVDPQSKKPTLPPTEHPIWKSLLLRLPNLEYFNLIPIDNLSRHRAWAYTKSKKLHPLVGAALWNCAINSYPPVQALGQAGHGWKPQAILEVSLGAMSLLSFNVYPLRHSLQVLDLRQNQITTLVGSGLHLCTRLVSVNLSLNKLHETDELFMLGHLPLLQSVWLEGNPHLVAEQYQSVVIYATRHVQGLNRCPGLQQLDGAAITFDQRLAAYALHAPNSKTQTAAERWRLLLIQQIGHVQLQSIPANFVSLHMPSRPLLEFADVSALTGLVSLDLRSNKLKAVGGLEKLVRLRVLDVRFNPELVHKLLIAQVQALGASIEWVSLSHTEEEMLDLTGLRAKFLAALLPHCPKLAVLDHRRILATEYVRTWKKHKSLVEDSLECQLYKLNLGLVMGNTPLVGRRYDPESVVPNLPGSQVLFSSVHTLHLSGLKLTDSFPLPDLPNLTLLDLSHNKLTLILPLGLSRFPMLLYLDLRHNKLKFTPMEYASSIAVCHKLHAVAIAGNPGVTPKFRQKLIACIPELASLDCELKIIDTYVAIDERVASWGAASHVLSGGEEGASPSPPVSARGGLGLEGMDSPASDASDASGAASPSLASPKGGHKKHLSIRQQPLPAGPTDSRAYQHTLKTNATNLSIHELAKKTLQKEREIAMTAESRPKADKGLVSPSSGGGASSPGPGPASPSGVNARLIAMHSNRQVVKAAPLSKAAAAAAIREQEALERNIFKFHLVLQEHCPPGQESAAIRELPLVGLTLQWVDVHAFTNLTKLLISRNQLTTLAHCGIETLKHLIVLDAHHNRLWNLSEVIGICNELPQLVVINFFRNPFAQFDRGEVATVEKTSAAMGLLAATENARSATPEPAATPRSPGELASPSTLGVPTEKRERRDSFSSNALLSPEKYRLTFIGHLQQLQSPARCLKFLDHAFVTEDEIIHGLKELGHSAADREMFRFNSIVFDKNGLDPAFVVLKLSARKLQRSDFSRFPYLTSLDIHRNLYTDESLLDSHLPKLQQLVELDLSDNRIKEMKPLAAMIQALPKLKHLRLLNNPGYPKVDTDNARKRFLACFSNVHMVSFSLEYLNQQLVTIEERILALHEMKLRWNQIHPANMLDRMRSVEIHTTVAKDVLSPKQVAEEEKKMADHAAAPPSVPVGVEAELAAAAAAAAAPAAPAAPLKLLLQDPSQIAASKEATIAQIVAQGGTPLNIDEDVTVQGENARFILSCAAADVKPGTTELCLRKRSLRLLGGPHLGIASYEALCIVDLRENNLSDLTNSGIDQLKKMHTLDLRANEFTNLETLVVSLRGCNALRWLYLQFSTKTRDETSVPQTYAPGVFADLRGLHRLDEIENDNCVTKNPIALSAQQLLWKIARIGPNNLKRVDLSNRRLPTTLFYTVLSALYYLDIQELMAGGNNEWSLHPQYSDVIILLLGPKFKWLDGVAITDQRRMLAFRADKQGKQSGKITGNIVVWEDQYKIIHEEVDEWLAADRAKHGEFAADGAGGKKKPGDVDHRLNMPNMQAVNVNGAAASSSTSNNPGILSKLDIVVHYLQVYGMVLVMDINIPYPQAFDDWSSWIRLSTLNLEDLFTLDNEYQQEVLFGVVMLAPAMLLGLYFYFDGLRGRQDDWADSYITKWRATKWRAFIVWFVLNLVAVGCCFFFIGDFESYNRVRDGGVPTSIAATWMLVIFCFSTVWYFLWWRTVALFQKHWNKDDSELKQDFKASWLNFIHWMQILFLFIITSIYLPVARVILIQFACDCVTENADNLCTSRLYSNTSCFPDPVTRVQGAAFVFAVLYILLLPLFIIKLIREGIAIVMDLNTVYELLAKEVLILRQDIKLLKRQKKDSSKAAADPAQAAANAGAIDNKIVEHRAAIVAKQKQMEKEYFGRINDPIRKLASTSLYSAYEYDWRFWKIIQLVQNLLLVCISLFVPSTLGIVTEARLFLGCFAIGSCFLFACWVRPYYDSWEDGMEIMAGLANTITILVALGLQHRMEWLTTSRANAILFGANITAVFAFMVAIIIVPFRVCRQRRRHKKATKEAEQRMKVLNEENKKKRLARVAAAKAAEAGLDPAAAAAASAAPATAKGAKPTGKPVSIEMQPVKRR